MEEIRIDLRKATLEEIEQGVKDAQLNFKFNHTMPYTEEYNQLMHELFAEVGEGSRVMNPTSVVRGGNVKIGRNVVVMNNNFFKRETGLTPKEYRESRLSAAKVDKRPV